MNTMLARCLSLAVLGCAMLPVTLHAQIVGGASGSIDLEQFTYLNDDPNSPVTVADSVPISLADQSLSLDLSAYGYAEGVSAVDYEYSTSGPASAWFDIHANTQPVPGASHATAGFFLDLTITAPVKYRIDAEIDRGWLGSYAITFNNITGTAYWDELTAADGTFPLVYCCQPDSDTAYGWYPYVNEGVLPAGRYRLAIETFSRSGRYFDPGDFEATASLHLQLLGDVNQDGFVGLSDLGAILEDWNKAAPVGSSLARDLDGDGFVGITDLNMVLSAWNADVRPSPPADTAVPEPAAVFMVGLFALGLRRLHL